MCLSTGSAGNVDETAGVLGALDVDVAQGLRTMMARTRHMSKFPHVASWAPSLFLEKFEMVASKALLRRCETTVASRVQRSHVARVAKVLQEHVRLAQEFLATEHWRFELCAQTHLDR